MRLLVNTLLALLFFGAGLAQAVEVRTGTESVDGIRIFFREAGDKDKPSIVLLHGFPSSSFMFRDLIPRLANDFHVIAPDYPGMGFSEAPPANKFTATFDQVARVMERFLEQRGIGRSVLYEQDFGGPVGMRIAVWHPDRVAGLVLQNTPISMDGWNAARLAAIRASQSLTETDRRQAAESRVAPATAKFLYSSGTRDPDRLAPEALAVDAYVMSQPESKRIMTDLQVDIPANFDQYEIWQRYLAAHRPRTLVVWGRGDPIFSIEGAEAVKRYVPEADVRYYDTGHFALEENAQEIAAAIIRTFRTPERH